ncbi:hypothetical protein ACFOPQ_15095 [Deinococcus antarcticus]|uniref:Uncharacterized protein n=1 Tax=Deinococcus antarcticus TaxID=1298767 RepID=A0ABV8A8P8_9DEIO
MTLGLIGASEVLKKQCLVRQPAVGKEHDSLWMLNTQTGPKQETLREFRRSGANLSLDLELGLWIDHGRVPLGVVLVVHEVMPFIGLQARDLQVTSLRVMERLSVFTAGLDDARDGRSVTADEFSRFQEAVASGDVLDDVHHFGMRDFTVPERSSLELTEFRAAGTAFQEATLVSAVKLAELNIPPTRLLKMWTGGVLTDETLNWE